MPELVFFGQFCGSLYIFLGEQVWFYFKSFKCHKREEKDWIYKIEKEYNEARENIGKLNVALVREEIEMSSDSV